MTFRVLDALPILLSRYGETINKVPDDRNGRKGYENKKVMGFDTGNGKVLALDVEESNLNCVKIWIEPPSPPTLAGVTVLPTKESHDLHRAALMRLGHKKGIYLLTETKNAFEGLLAWYA
ncbi:MAG: hypothetical protein FJX25_08105 [Alphaproteobacteria bacterium]|nr:hypothetical protein [Alphaproteobacteria bacterium]